MTSNSKDSETPEIPKIPKVSRDVRRYIHYEVLTNQITGQLMGFLVVLLLFPLIGIPVSFGQATLSSVIFFVMSYARMTVIRFVFEKLKTMKGIK